MFQLPAATTYVMPALTDLHTALCRASLRLLLQLASDDVTEPKPPRLMLATLIPCTALFAVTQSTPQMTDAHVPSPFWSSDLTAINLAPGAMPTTPLKLSRAA